VFNLSEKNKSLTEQTADKILNYILDNNLIAGDKIPNEFELAEKVGVGRSTIREAVKILISRNILNIKHGAGTYISYNTGISDDPLGLIFTKDKYKLAMDLFQVRIILEPEIASIAANKANDNDIAKIIKYCDETENLIKNNIDHMSADIAFHEAIAKCTGNIVITKLIPIINTSVAIFVNITSRRLKSETISTHRDVADAIARHDSVAAKNAMTMHLLYNNKYINEIISKKTLI